MAFVRGGFTPGGAQIRIPEDAHDFRVGLALVEVQACGAVHVDMMAGIFQIIGTLQRRADGAVFLDRTRTTRIVLGGELDVTCRATSIRGARRPGGNRASTSRWADDDEPVTRARGDHRRTPDHHGIEAVEIGFVDREHRGAGIDRDIRAVVGGEIRSAEVPRSPGGHRE